MDTTATDKSKANIARRIINVMQSEGIEGVLHRVASRVNHVISLRRLYLYYYTLYPEMPIPPVKTAVQFQVIAPSDLATLYETASLYGAPTSYEVMQQRMNLGEFCYIGKVDGKVAAYVWFRISGLVQESGMTLYTLKPEDVYIHDAYTIQEQRGKNIYPAMKAIAGRDMAVKYNKKRMISIIERDNRSSLKSTAKLGETYFGWIGWLKIFKKRYPFRLKRF
jgi:hypothetical protein